MCGVNILSAEGRAPLELIPHLLLRNPLLIHSDLDGFPFAHHNLELNDEFVLYRGRGQRKQVRKAPVSKELITGF